MGGKARMGRIGGMGGVALLSLVLLLGSGRPLLSQSPGSLVWLAGRYDRSHVVIYFQAVKFKDSFPANARKIDSPIANTFFEPSVVPASALAEFQRSPGAERFAIGDRYDLLLGNGRSGAVTLTALVAFEGDEFTGNDSYIGALGEVEARALPFFKGDYFVVRRHIAQSRTVPNRPGFRPAAFSRVVDEPVPPAVQREITALLRARLAAGAEVPAAVRNELEQTPPSELRSQQIGFVDGSQRYNVWAEFRLHDVCLAASAWVRAQPLRIVAMEEPFCELRGLDPVSPRIRAVVDLDEGRTGLVVDFQGGDGRSLRLLEYRDGAALAEMRELHSVGAGE